MIDFQINDNEVVVFIIWEDDDIRIKFFDLFGFYKNEQGFGIYCKEGEENLKQIWESILEIGFFD